MQLSVRRDPWAVSHGPVTARSRMRQQTRLHDGQGSSNRL